MIQEPNQNNLMQKPQQTTPPKPLCARIFLCCYRFSHCVFSFGECCSCFCCLLVFVVITLAIYLFIKCSSIGVLGCTKGILHGFSNTTNK